MGCGRRFVHNALDRIVGLVGEPGYATDPIDLKECGVSERIIDYMINTAQMQMVPAEKLPALRASLRGADVLLRVVIANASVVTADATF